MVALSALQDEQRTKQGFYSGPGVLALVSIRLGLFGQGQHDDYKKPNCQQHDHNNTAIQILFSGCRGFICCITALDLLHKALKCWFRNSAPRLSSTLLKFCCFFHCNVMQHSAHMVHCIDIFSRLRSRTINVKKMFKVVQQYKAILKNVQLHKYHMSRKCNTRERAYNIKV